MDAEERHAPEVVPHGGNRLAIIGTRGYPSYYGGFETLVRRLGPFLAERGWDVTVYGRPGATRADDPSRDPRVRAKVTRGMESKSLSTLTFGLTASMDAALRKADVALVMNVANGYWLPILKARGVPTVVNVDGIEWEREKWGRGAKSLFRAGARLTAACADTLIYDAQEISRIWRARYGKNGVVIPYGGDRPAQLQVVAPFTRRRYALMVARFVPENNVEAFFDAAAAVSCSADVVIVGSSGYGGPLDQRAASLAQENPSVHWLGHVSDDSVLHSLWKHAGAYFHGHSVGGTNPALVQAMACGAPTVAQDTPYNREVLGDAGTFVDVVDGNLADVLTQVIEQDDEELDRMSSAVQERADRHYRWTDICSRYEDALLRALG